jgi:hypothetical protein
MKKLKFDNRRCVYCEGTVVAIWRESGTAPIKFACEAHKEKLQAYERTQREKEGYCKAADWATWMNL